MLESNSILEIEIMQNYSLAVFGIVLIKIAGFVCLPH